VPGGGSGILAADGGAPAGSFVSLTPPAGVGLTVIVETLGNTACKKDRSPAPINASFTTAGANLPGEGVTLNVWLTTRNAYFVRQPDITLGAGGTFSLQVPPDAILTASTTQGAARGSFPASPIPPAAQWPLPFADDFSSYAEDSMARFFSDQGGSWAVRGGALVMTAAADPGGNAWAPNTDPLVQVGDESWADYAVAVTVSFNTTGPYAPHPRRARRGGAGLAREAAWRSSGGASAAAAAYGDGGPNTGLSLAPCDPTDPAQAFVQPAPGLPARYIQNKASTGCLDINGCGALVDLYECVSDPTGSSCGAPAGRYPNLQWSYAAATGTLTSDLQGLVLTAARNGSLFALPPAGGANSTWNWNATSGALSLRGGGGQCVSAPPVARYARVCGRVASFSGFAGTLEAYCFSVKASGAWVLAAISGGAEGPGRALASGSLAAFDPHARTTLGLSFTGTWVTASVGGAQVASVSDGAFAAGNVLLGTGWHGSAWRDFRVDPA
jgi:hypothetical protein